MTFHEKVAPTADSDAGQKVAPKCHAEAPSGVFLVETDNGGHHGDTTGRQRSQGHTELGQGSGAQRGEPPVPEVRPEVGSGVVLGRPDVRSGVPLGGLQLRVHDHARLGVDRRCPSEFADREGRCPKCGYKPARLTAKGMVRTHKTRVTSPGVGALSLQSSEDEK